MDSNVEFVVFYFPFDDGGEFSFLSTIHVGATTYDLCPWARFCGSIVAIEMLMSCDDELAVCCLEQGNPQLGTCTLP